MFDPVLGSLPAFATYFAAAFAIVALFLAVYALVTPYNELALIRQGNAAAAVSLGGTLLGLVLPVAVAVAVSHNLATMLGWGLVACVVQLLAYLTARLILPQIAADIPHGKPAAGIFLASLSIGVGIINAACII